MQLTGTTLVPYPDLMLACAPSTSPEEGQVLMAGANGNNVWTDAYKPTIHRVKLTASGWSNNIQTVTVQGVAASEGNQVIIAAPESGYAPQYYDSGILMSAQAANTILFTCDSAPDDDLYVYISVQDGKLPM